MLAEIAILLLYEFTNDIREFARSVNKQSLFDS